MTWLKKNLLFSIAMAILAAVMVVEIVMILRERGHALELEAAYQAQVNEHQRLATQDVLPHEKNVELTEVEIDNRLEELAIYEEAMDGREGLDEAFAAHPTTGPDAVFDIASFVNEYRERAIQAGLDPAGIETTHFSFEEYATVGPEPSQLASIYKQRLIVAYILDKLLTAQPQSLIEIRRPGIITPPTPEGEAGATTSQSRRGEPQPVVGAEFSLNPQLSVAIPEVAETTAYQVTFTGRSSTLRAFLNELTSFDMPLIVRNIEVASLSEGGEQRRAPAARRTTRRRRTVQEETGTAPVDGAETATEPVESALTPVIADNLSRYTVAMEFVDIVHPDAESGNE